MTGALQPHPVVAKLDLVPYERFGPFRFGMGRDEVLEILRIPGADPRTLHRLNETPETAVEYESVGLSIQFDGRDPDSRVNSVAARPGSGPPVWVNGIELEGGWRRITNALKRSGVTLFTPADWDCTVRSDEFGLGLLKSDPPGFVAEVRAWKRGYWEAASG